MKEMKKRKNESYFSVSIDSLFLILEKKSLEREKCSNLYYSAVKIDLSLMKALERMGYTM